MSIEYAINDDNTAEQIFARAQGLMLLRALLMINPALVI